MHRTLLPVTDDPAAWEGFLQRLAALFPQGTVLPSTPLASFDGTRVDLTSVVILMEAEGAPAGIQNLAGTSQRAAESTCPLVLVTRDRPTLTDRILAFRLGGWGVVSLREGPCELVWRLAAGIGAAGTAGSHRDAASVRFGLLLGDAAEPVLLVDDRLRVVLANTAAGGCGAVSGIPVMECVTPPEREALDQQLRQVFSGRPATGISHGPDGKPPHVVGEVEETGGQFAVVRLAALPGSPPEAGSMAEALLESQVRADAVLNTVVDGVITIDPAGTVVDFNRSAARMFGYEPVEIIGQPISRLMPEPYAREHRGYVDRYLQTGERHIIGIGREAVGLRRDGRIFPIELAVSEVRVGDRLLFTGLVRDITDRKLAEAERDRLAAVIEQTEEAVVITDLSGGIEYVNPAFERGTGYTREEVLGRNPRVFASGRHAPGFFAGMWSTIAGGAFWRGHVVNRRKDGGLIEVRQVIGPVKDRQGRTTNYVSIWQDVTRERALEEQVRQAQKLDGIGRLAGGIVHDFNNVLSAILGYAQVLADRLGPQPDLQPLAAGITATAERGTNLTRQLLAFCRRQSVRPSPVDLNDVIHALEPLLRRTLGAEATLVCEGATKPARVLADFGQLEQVVMNLAINARDAMPRGGRLGIRVVEGRAPGGGPHWGITVTDTGVGIPPEVREHLFEPFFTTKGEGKGTGLGLAVVYGVVRQHGGTIEVESTPGQGSTFRILFPAIEEAPRAPGPVTTPEAQRGTGRLLVVEDDPDVCRSLSLTLESLGYQVVTAPGATEALQIAHSQVEPIDLVLCDLALEGVAGPALVSRLRERLLDVGVVYVTGQADVKVNGVVLQKPFTRHQLATAVHQGIHTSP